MAMRGFANHPDLFRGFAMEAPLWLDSLAMADPYGLMPVLTSAIMLTNIEIFGSVDTEVAAAQPLVENKESENVAGQGTFEKYRKWIVRGTSLLFIPMTWNFPAGVFIFMSTNMIATTLQNQLLKLPVLERLLELPPTPERSAAAAKMVEATGPLGLVALGGTLRHAPGWSLGRVVHPSQALLQGGAGGAPKVRKPKQPAPAAPESSDGAGSGVARRAPTLEDLVVDPRFAVTRARPARPASAL
mmetsp:Transcript_12483/g.37649  ORF Transcript_12483/g.37649 Transcript_12483/m.37649 type:complete len:244 (+) Transcript_12483:1-732(+)